jgi:hypothetical protein
MNTIGSRLADTADLAIYLVGVLACIALAGGTINLRLRSHWQVLKKRGLIDDCPPLTDTKVRPAWPPFYPEDE